jgi:hypothetical protein
MTQGLALAALRNAEFLQFAKDVRTIVQLNNPATLLVANEYATYSSSSQELEALFATDQGNDTTPIIQALDESRDKAITGIRLLANAMVYHFDSVKSDAAKKLIDNMDLHGSGIAYQNYMAETASISKLLDDWEGQDELSAAITALGIEDWKNELELTNNEFHQQYIARTQAMAAASPDTLKEKRLESAQHYYRLRDKIVAYSTINGGIDPWGKTIKELNMLIEQYTVLLAVRHGKGQQPEATPKSTPPQA